MCLFDTLEKNHLKKHFTKVCNILKMNPIPCIRKKDIYRFVKTIENYAFENKELSMFCLQIEALEYANIVFEDIALTHDDIKVKIGRLSNIYKMHRKFIHGFLDIINTIKKLPFDEHLHTSAVLKTNITSKWMLEYNKEILFAFLARLEGHTLPKQIIIYSINIDDITIEILTKIIETILTDPYMLIPKKYEVRTVDISEELFDWEDLESYEAIINDKVYLIKRFNLESSDILPSGLSTAYLNIKGNFQSAGYLSKIDDNNPIYFLAIEEKMDCFFTTDNFEIFVNNEKQLLYFFLDFLYFIYNLDKYKIKLTGSKILFSFMKDPKR